MTSKKWFPGWGMMRLWETGGSLKGAGHNFADRTEGEGSEPAFPGEVKSGSWDYPVRDTLRFLSAMPRRAEYH